MRQHPDLRPEQVYAALAYHYDHRAEIFDLLAQRGEAIGEIEKQLNRPGLSRIELLTRRSSYSVDSFQSRSYKFDRSWNLPSN